MRRFRYSSWKFLLVMFVLIAIFYSDVGYGQPKKEKTTFKEQIISAAPATEVIE